MRPSWISNRHNFSFFHSRSHPVITEQVSAQRDQRFGKKCRKLIFKTAAVVAILNCLMAHLAILCLLGALMLTIVLIQLDYRGDVQNMNSLHFSHINAQGLYKCMGKQI